MDAPEHRVSGVSAPVVRVEVPPDQFEAETTRDSPAGVGAHPHGGRHIVGATPAPARTSSAIVASRSIPPSVSAVWRMCR